tara:strand:- start:9597 stop:10487 length:891 start_codon:yes stop_codon:yes gene_type:complete
MSQFPLSKGVKQEPEWLAVYGVEGVGKTTFATDSSRPIIIDVEGGSAEIDTTRIESEHLKSLDSVIAAIKSVQESPGFDNIIIDSLSKVEELIWDATCKRKSVAGKNYKSIEDFGYKQGYIFCLDEWNLFLDACEEARSFGKGVILIGHSKTKKFDDPTLAEGYMRYEIDIHEKASARIRKYVKAILFANYKTLVKDGKGLETGERQLLTERRPGHDAKNRYNLPYEMPLSWKDYQATKAVSVVTADKVIGQINGMITEIADETTREKIEELVKVERDINKLQAYLIRVEEIVLNQ